MSDPADQEFSWVPARYSCSAFGVYKQLQSGCERDVKERNALRDTSGANRQYGFKVTADGTSFHVLREGDRISAGIEIRLTGAVIAVIGDDRKVMFEAALTLNDHGECRLKVGNEELTFWQFRKRALEDLLFRF